MYKVIVCPDEYCRGVSIIEGEVETSKCSKCDTQYSLDRYKTSYTTDSKESAVKARSKLLLKIRNEDKNYEDIKDKGLLDSPKSFSQKNKKDTRNPKQIIRDAFQERKGEREKIINNAIKSPKVDREKAKRYIQKMVRDGEILDYGDELQLID